MPTLFSGINTALSSLLAHQAMIEVIEHNVANANTPGYHRQSAVLQAGPGNPGTPFAGLIGSGVAVDSIRRFNIQFYDARLRQETAESKRWDFENTILKQMEVTLAETTTDGLTSKLDSFWAGWQALSDDPSNMALRSDLKERAEALTDAFNWRAEALTDMRQDQNLAIQERVDEVNGLASQLARLNGEISKIRASGNAPNDLLDQRDLIADRLSEITGAITHMQPDGQALVSISGHALVFGTKANQLYTDTVPAQAPTSGDAMLDPWDAKTAGQLEIHWKDSVQASFSVTRGELAGIFDARDNVIPAQLDALNNLAYELSTRINVQHSAGEGLVPFNGTNADGTSRGPNFFEPLSAGNPENARLIKLSVDINDPRNIAAASAGANSGPGNGENAVAIGQLAQMPYMNGVSTFNQYYTGKVGELGLTISSTAARAKDRKSVADSLSQMKESAVGVNLDEEAASLIKTQRAYQAAARMMTTLDEMLDRVINGLGVGGR